MITAEQTQLQKNLLPRGWGRFGKAIDQITTVAGADESLIAACVTLNPTFHHRAITLAGGLFELRQSTNVVLALMDRRIIVVATNVAGSPQSDHTISLEGLTVVDHGKKDLTLRWSEGQAEFKGAAKTMLGPFVSALQARLAAAG